MVKRNGEAILLLGCCESGQMKSFISDRMALTALLYIQFFAAALTLSLYLYFFMKRRFSSNISIAFRGTLWSDEMSRDISLFIWGFKFSEI